MSNTSETKMDTSGSVSSLFENSLSFDNENFNRSSTPTTPQKRRMHDDDNSKSDCEKKTNVPHENAQDSLAEDEYAADYAYWMNNATLSPFDMGIKRQHHVHILPEYTVEFITGFNLNTAIVRSDIETIVITYIVALREFILDLPDNISTVELKKLLTDFCDEIMLNYS